MTEDLSQLYHQLCKTRVIINQLPNDQRLHIVTIPQLVLYHPHEL